MGTIGALAAIVAAVVGCIGLLLGLQERRRGRLLEILDLVTQLKTIIDWGPEGLLYHEDVQGRLRARIGRLPLPVTRRFAESTLRCSPEWSELAGEAIVEVRGELERHHLLRPWRSSTE
jgi:hypothetical protein